MQADRYFRGGTDSYKQRAALRAISKVKMLREPLRSGDDVSELNLGEKTTEKVRSTDLTLRSSCAGHGPPVTALLASCHTH